MSTSAHAATPVAEWTDFHNLTSGNYTWIKNSSCTVNADGSLTIGKSGGLSMSFSSGTIHANKAVSIIAEVENAAAGSDKRSIFDISVSGNRVGLTTFADGVTYQTWNRDTTGYGNIGKLDTGAHTLILTYSASAGTTTFVDGTQKANHSGLKSSSGAVNGLGFGCYNGSNNAFEGLKVKRIALYDKKLTGEDLGMPDVWYKFDGNYDSSGATALNFNGEKADNWVDSRFSQALKIVNGSTHPYGNNWTFGSGAWNVTAVVRMIDDTSNKNPIWITGVKGGWFGLMADYPNRKMLLAYGDGSTINTICSVNAPADCAGAFHLYTVSCDGKGNFSLILDENLSGKSTASYPGTIPSGNYQLGSVNQGCPTGAARTTGTAIDDLRIFCYALTDEQIIAISREFNPPSTTYRATMSKDTEWDALVWSPAKPEGGFETGAILDITVTGTPTLSFDKAVSLKCSAIIHGTPQIKAADALYEDGCWTLPFAEFSSLTTTDAVTFAPVKTGFVGAYSQTVRSFDLRAQNKEVISINFANGQSVSGTGYTGLAPVQGNTWMNMTETWSSGGRTVDLGTFKVTADGSTVTTRGTIGGTCYAANTYGWNAATDVFLKGYLDDGGNHAQVSVTNIPYSSYDVIVYCATDNASKQFAAVTLNGTTYTYDSANPTVAKVGTGTWGQSQNTTAVYGTNAIRIRNIQSSSLAIVGGANDNNARGGIAAIQIVCTGDVEEIHDYTATISSSTNFDDISWKEGPFKEGVLTTATITIGDTPTDEVAITFGSPAIVLKSLTIISKRDVRLVGSAGLVNVASIDVSKCTGKVTYAIPVTALASSQNERIFYAGGTVEGHTVAIGLNGGVLNLTGGTYGLQESVNATATTVNMADSIIGYSDVFGVGTATYNVSGNSTVNTPRIVLSQGQAGRTSVVVLSGDAALTVTGNTNGDNNQSSALFGHWNGTSTFTLRDHATFTADAAQVLVGLTSNTHTINIEGGVFKALGIRASAGATGTNTLNLNGGELVLGDVGISAYGSTTISVNVGGNAKISAFESTMAITQPMTIGSGKTLTIDANGAAITVSGALAGAGNITVLDSSVGKTGSVAFTGNVDAFTGTITYTSCKYDFGTTRTLPSYVRFSGAETLAVQTTAEYGQGRASAFTGLPEGLKILLRKLDGTTETLTADAEGRAASTPGSVHIDGPATYADATFTNATSHLEGYAHVGALSYKSIDTLGLQYDSAVTTNAAGTGAYLKHHPWIKNLPNAFMQSEAMTIAVVGEMSPSNNTVFVHVGTTTGTNKGIILATGTKEDEVVVKLNTGLELTEITTMTVPQAATARHVYIITKQDTGNASTVSVHLDGKLWKTVTFDSISLVGGVQCGSDHGGELHRHDPPLVNAVSADDTALINVLRVYDRVIDAIEIEAYSKAYPYVSGSGASSRTFGDTGAFWTEPLGQKCWKFTKSSTTVTTNEAVAASSVTIDSTEGVATTVSVNLAKDVNYEAVTIAGDGAFKFVKVPGKEGKIVSGNTTIGCPVAIEFGSLDISGAPLSLEGAGAVTFDLSSIDVDSYWSDTVIQVTGITAESEKITQTGLGTAPGRKATFGYNGSQYVVTIKVAGDLTADLNGTKDFSDLTWTMGGETIVSVPWTSVPKVYINVTGDSQLTFTKNFDHANVRLFVTNANAITVKKLNDVTLNVNGWDFQKLDAKATFAFDPAAAVLGGYVRFNLDMGEKSVATIMAANQGIYEFKRVTLVGLDGQGGRTVRVPEGDEVTLKNASYADARSSVSLDVCGGTVYMAPAANAAVWYGDDTTRFNLSAGTVYAQATGQSQAEKDSASGFLIGWSGRPVEFNVSGGVLDVSGSSVNFWTAGVTNNITGGKVKAKGVFCGNKAPGVINVSGAGVFEVGSLGVTADACTLNLNGGILRGYEAGAVFKSAVVQKGATTVASTEGADLALSGTFTGSDIVAIPEGTVKLGKASALGTGALTVADGATLDLNGYVPGNAITILGTGAEGTGALVNTGKDVGFAGTLTLAGDARIGGTARIGYNQGSTINLTGHALTIAGSGTGATLALGGMTVQGGGQVVVGEKGTLASNGATALGSACDLVIGEKGTLDLSAGSSFSMRNFTNAGTITGNQAGIIVNGTLDASAATPLPKLTLHDGATLKGGDEGIKLELTTKNLALGKTLNVTVEKVAPNIKLATVPENTPIDPSATALVVNGIEGTYTLELQGTSLLASSGGGNYAEVALSSVLGWTNFESLKIEGSLENMRVITQGTTNIDVIVAYESGVVTTQRFVYAGGPGGKFSYVLDGFRPGERYDVSAYVLIDTVSISEESPNVNAMTARTLNQWIDEDSQTFGGKRIGTGSWRNDDKIATVKGETIVFAAATRDQQLSFTSTNRSQIAERGAQKEIRLSETFTAASYCAGEEDPPALPSVEGLVAVTLATNAQGVCQFAVVTTNGWEAIDAATSKPILGRAYEIVVRIDESTGTISYGALDVSEKKFDWLVREAPYKPMSESSAVIKIVFTGAGTIKKIDGLCHDANLMQVTVGGVSREYATIGEALAAAGEKNAIEPLWWSNYKVTDERGSFRVVDAKGYFEPIFAKWYHYEKTPGEVMDSYRYVAANNWIEYSDEAGVEQEANGTYRVMTEQGLAWIAEQATNGVFEGAVTLGDDLDLSSKNWTPIANFTGSFDGKGFMIEGLNNTNVVIDPLLGEAGYYFGGTTNASGYSAYGLFGCTKDAAFRNITLRDVAISNTADSVAALVGVHALGDLTVEGVTNASGVVWGEGNVVAGLVTIGGNGGEVGNVVVKGNTNSVEIVGREDANLAQILAGTPADTKFTGTVEVADNGGQEVPVGEWYLYMPICNFAAVVERYDAWTNYWRYVEANEKDSVPIDPVKKTARMLAGFYENGSPNYMGQLTDLITASGDGAVLALPGTGETVDGWSTILVDRNLTMDLNGNALYGVYDCDVFNLSEGVTFTIKNGTVYSVEGYKAFAGDTTGLTTEGVTLVQLSGDFYHRTVPPSSLDVANGTVRIVVPHSSDVCTYILESKASLSDEWSEVDDQWGTGTELTFEVPATGDQGFYRIRMERMGD